MKVSVSLNRVLCYRKISSTSEVKISQPRRERKSRSTVRCRSGYCQTQQL